jgi:LTXXQ motif family protein
MLRCMLLASAGTLALMGAACAPPPVYLPPPPVQVMTGGGASWAREAAAVAYAPPSTARKPSPRRWPATMGGAMKGGGMTGAGTQLEQQAYDRGLDAGRHDRDYVAYVEDMMKGCDIMCDMDHMLHMMSVMREELSHAGDRVASLKTELKITEAQMPAWNKFADALLASGKSMEEAIDAMHKNMMQSGAALSLPERLEQHAKMAARYLANLQAIKAALDPLYASFSDEQKKLADRLKVGPMGVM